MAHPRLTERLVVIDIEVVAGPQVVLQLGIEQRRCRCWRVRRADLPRQTLVLPARDLSDAGARSASDSSGVIGVLPDERMQGELICVASLYEKLPVSVRLSIVASRRRAAARRP